LLQLELKVKNEPWHVFYLKFDAFPGACDEIRKVRDFIRKLTAGMVREWKETFDIFVQMSALKHDDGSAPLFSRHGREWLPAMGLGVWPDRPPPTIWSREDFENLQPGELPRILAYQVFRITASPEVKERARDTMLGLGSIVQIMGNDSIEDFLTKSRNALLPPITDPSFTCFPFYLPLLDLQSFSSAKPKELDYWLCDANIYIRESMEDQGLLLAVRRLPNEVFKLVGGSERRSSDTVRWEFPEL